MDNHMNVTGIIAEYNPFHNGHFYQIEKIKQETGTDCIAIVLSGDFVQRGAPAVVDKYARTRMALACGADLVFELPVLWASASAEYFAAAGIALLDKLGIVNTVCFGTECRDIAPLSQAADILLTQPAIYRQTLNENLKKGFSFPAARAGAVLEYVSAQGACHTSPGELAAVLTTPNNILAVEYLKELKRRNSAILPHPILRRGAGYHDTAIKTLSSAGGIRKALLFGKKEQKKIASAMPAPAYSILSRYMKKYPTLSEDAFSSVVKYKLLCAAPTGYEEFADCNKPLSNRILKSLNEYTTLSNFCRALKSREVTYNRLMRIFTHILLDIKKDDYVLGRQLDYIPYLRLLGFRKSAALALHELKLKSPVPILTKMADADAVLKKYYPAASFAHRMLSLDLFAADIYASVIAALSETPVKNEYNQGLVLK